MTFPRSLTPKGTGLPDFSQAVQTVTGSVHIYGSTNLVSALARIGTLGRIGSVRYVQAGSLGRVERVGTIGRVTSIGTIRNIIAGQDVITAVDLQSHYTPGTVMRNARPLGPGSVWVGSWQDVQNYYNKTFVVYSQRAAILGHGGSFAIIAGLTGTGVNSITGTYSGPTQVGAGSYRAFSLTDSLRYVRPYFKRSGSSRGSVSVGLARQA